MPPLGSRTIMPFSSTDILTTFLPTVTTAVPTIIPSATPPSPPTPRQSSCIAARLRSHVPALLAEFVPFRDSHILIPLVADPLLQSIDTILHALSSGSATPVLSDNNDPL
jgi:hypothetical protein